MNEEREHCVTIGKRRMLEKRSAASKGSTSIRM